MRLNPYRDIELHLAVSKGRLHALRRDNMPHGIVAGTLIQFKHFAFHNPIADSAENPLMIRAVLVAVNTRGV